MAHVATGRADVAEHRHPAGPTEPPSQEAGRHPPPQPLHKVLPLGIDRLGANPVLLRHLRPTRMRTRLARWGLTSVEDLWQADPLQLRAAWGSVTGVRLWYALHGYAVAPPRTQRRSIGHGRVSRP